MIKSQVGNEAIVFHGLYNIASISVLCLISAQSHSILNVGKRVVNVLYVSVAFSEPIGFRGIIGLCIAAMGSILYSFGGGGVTTFWGRCVTATRGYFYIIVIGMMISNIFSTANLASYGFDRGTKSAWGWSSMINDVSMEYAVVYQRFGRKMIETGFQQDFHFLLESRSDLGWRTNRAIEHVFYFHRNCKVVVHSNQIILSDLEIFVETGYNLVVQPYNLDSLLKDVFPFHNKSKDELLQGSLPLLLLRKHGGLYLSKETLLLQRIPADLEEGLILQENDSPSVAYFDRESKGVNNSSLTSIVRSERLLETSNNLTWSVQVLSDIDTVKCMEDIKWSLPDGPKEMIAVSLHPSSYASTETIKIDTKCYEFVEKLCIFCDEIHWDFN